MVNTLTMEDVLVDCQIGSSRPIRFLIDTGADANIIGGKDWLELQSDSKKGLVVFNGLKTTGWTSLRAYAAENPLKVECRFRATISTCDRDNNTQAEAEFVVVPRGQRSLVGRSTAADLSLLRIAPTVNACESAYSEGIFPKMPGVKVRFSLDESVPPERNAYYNVPAAFRDAARLRLQEMENRGIIEKVTTAPNWISGMSAVAKGNTASSWIGRPVLQHRSSSFFI